MKWDVLAFLVFLMFALTACGAGNTPAPAESTAPVPAPTATPAPEPTPAPDPIQAQLDAMTLEEKVGQLFVVGFEGTTAGADVKSSLEELRAGGVILFKRNVESAGQLTALTNALKAMNPSEIPLFVSVDQEGGTVERMPPEVKRLPSAYDVGDPVLLGRTLAAECKAFGFNIDYAPSLDIWSNPNNTVIGKRAFGGDWEPVAVEGPAAAYAMLEEGVIPVVKHFPGHGDTATDSHVGLPVVEKTLEELRQAELVPFQTAIDGSSMLDGVTGRPVPAVMVSHILMTQIDPQRPATLSPAVVTDLLRGEMGFGGVVFTDDMTMGAITENYGLGEACVMALEAGCDVVLVCHGQDNIQGAYEAVLEAARSGRIDVDGHVYRILSLKQGLTDEPVGEVKLAALNAMVEEVWESR